MRKISITMRTIKIIQQISIIFATISFLLLIWNIVFAREPRSFRLLLDLPDSEEYWVTNTLMHYSPDIHPSALIISNNNLSMNIKGQNIQDFSESNSEYLSNLGSDVTIQSNIFVILPDSQSEFHVITDSLTGSEYDAEFISVIQSEIGRASLSQHPPLHRTFGFGFTTSKSGNCCLNPSKLDIPELKGLDFWLGSNSVKSLLISSFAVNNTGENYFKIYIPGRGSIKSHSGTLNVNNYTLEIALTPPFSFTSENSSDSIQVELFYRNPKDSKPIHADYIEVFEAKGTLFIGADQTYPLVGPGNYLKIDSSRPNILKWNKSQTFRISYSDKQVLIYGKTNDLIINDTQVIQNYFESLSQELKTALLTALFSLIGFISNYILNKSFKKEKSKR